MLDLWPLDTNQNTTQNKANGYNSLKNESATGHGEPCLHAAEEELFKADTSELIEDEGEYDDDLARRSVVGVDESSDESHERP